MTDPKTIPLASNPQAGFFANLSISAKLLLGFGFLVILTFIGAGINFMGSYQADSKITRMDVVRVPVVLAASKAQTDLLQMQADVRGYLVLGDQLYRNQYNQSSQAFEADLVELEKLSSAPNTLDTDRLNELKAAYQEWKTLPNQLFELRDDQLDREPAYRLLATDGIRYAGKVLIATNQLIETQGQSQPTAENLEILEDMAKFQGNFSSMLSALRGYVTTRNRIYRGEYDVNLVANQNSWERLSNKRSQLTSNQQDLLDTIAQNRDEFLKLPEQIFTTLESERWREDLYLFQTEAVPQADHMSSLLDELTSEQQSRLRQELAAGRQDLRNTTRLILAGGFVALTITLILTFVYRSTIARPIIRLTGVAEQIRSGDLEAQARVEARDEIGTLAVTFNNMTSQLRHTLTQVRKEKKRADDLLEVVIPIGVELTTERDFNRLLEKMLLEAKSFCHADTGLLYLVTEENNLKFTIVRSDTRNVALGGTTGKETTYPDLPLIDAQTGQPNHKHVAASAALNGNTINIYDDASAGHYDLLLDSETAAQEFDKYQAKTVLALPLKNSQGKSLGVLELINARDPESGEIIPFDTNLQQMMESFSSLAVAALEAYLREQLLRKEIHQLRIEIDEAKRQKQVEEIVGTDFFQHISNRAQELRQRKKDR